MDGYAVRAQEAAAGASPEAPVRLQLGQQARYVNTGDPLPEGFDAVIPQEEAQVAGDRLVVSKPVQAWRHIRIIGEDMVASELVVPANQRLRPQDLGAIAGSGHDRVRVYRRPRIAILPIGARLVAPSPDVEPGQIIEFNIMVLAAMAEEWGAFAHALPPSDCDLETLVQRVAAALDDHDLVVINAGAAGGARDYAESIISRLGQVDVRGVAIRPGHSVILGHARNKPIVAIPGFPVSAMTAFEQVVRPLLESWQGQSAAQPPEIQALIPRALPSDPTVDDFKRVLVAHSYRGVVARPLPQAAGAIMTMVRADGIIHIPRGQDGVRAETYARVALLRPPEAIANTILHIGSHDLALDILADQLRRARPDRSLNSLHTGSLEGLQALARGEAHFAGCHLLDPQTGQYNITAIQQHLAHLPLVVMGFVQRDQGLLVQRGNPKGLRDLRDLLRPDITFVNRQPGSGTRLLLDYHLKRLGIDPQAIRGYDRSEFSHLTVAAAVKNGAADAGLGILAAARALDLDFVPLFQEHYQLVIPQAHYESPLLAPMLAIIRSADFRQTVAALGGYEVAGMGEIILPNSHTSRS
jgi:putative molybdopterin biosynthesis protein